MSACTLSHSQKLKTKIDEHYRVNMLLDNLPVTVYDLLDAVSAALCGSA